MLEQAQRALVGMRPGDGASGAPALVGDDPESEGDHEHRGGDELDGRPQEAVVVDGFVPRQTHQIVHGSEQLRPVVVEVPQRVHLLGRREVEELPRGEGERSEERGGLGLLVRRRPRLDGAAGRLEVERELRPARHDRVPAAQQHLDQRGQTLRLLARGGEREVLGLPHDGQHERACWRPSTSMRTNAARWSARHDHSEVAPTDREGDRAAIATSAPTILVDRVADGPMPERAMSKSGIHASFDVHEGPGATVPPQVGGCKEAARAGPGRSRVGDFACITISHLHHSTSAVRVIGPAQRGAQPHMPSGAGCTWSNPPSPPLPNTWLPAPPDTVVE
jgi:hypothetical protein